MDRRPCGRRRGARILELVPVFTAPCCSTPQGRREAVGALARKYSARSGWEAGWDNSYSAMADKGYDKVELLAGLRGCRRRNYDKVPQSPDAAGDTDVSFTAGVDDDFCPPKYSRTRPDSPYSKTLCHMASTTPKQQRPKSHSGGRATSSFGTKRAFEPPATMARFNGRALSADQPVYQAMVLCLDNMWWASKLRGST